MSAEAADIEHSTDEIGTGVVASSPETSVHSQHEFENPSIERPQSEAFEALEVDSLGHRLDQNGEAAINQQPRGAASKLKRPFAGLLLLLLAAAAASSGFLVAGRKLGGAPVPSAPSVAGEEAVPSPPPAEVPLPPAEVPLPPQEERVQVQQPAPEKAEAVPSAPSVAGEEAVPSPPPAEVPLPPAEVPLPPQEERVQVQQPAPEKAEEEKVEQPPAAPAAPEAKVEEEKQPELVEEEVTSRMTAEQEQKVIDWFEETFVEGTRDATFPLFLRGHPDAVQQFKEFLANYKADLAGGEEKDEGAREKRRLWTVFKMQVATLALVETMTFDQLSELPMSDGYDEAAQEINNKLKEVCKLKVDTAGLWLGLAKESGLHPDPTNDEAVQKLLRAQEVHYERALNRLNGVGPRSTPKAANYKGDPRLEYKKLCRGIGPGDEWLMYAMP
ncbi:hypothetical protein Emed_001952 [Eimeria media]